MMLIPQRLFASSQVKVILRDGNTCILSKELDQAIVKREGYISNHVIVILLAGEQQIRTYEEQLIRVRANEVLFIPRGMYHVSDLLPKSGNFKSLLFYFDDDIIQEFLSTTSVSTFNRDQVSDHLQFGDVPAVRLFADSLMAIYQQHQIRNKSFLRLKILELLYLLNSQAEEQQFADFLFRLTLPKRRNIRTFMEKNYDKPLKIEDYAYLTGRSLSSFRRDFKAFYDLTPQRWIKEKRLEKAQQLFDQNRGSVSEVAFEVGYESTSYFIREFKKKVGQSPKQYLLSRHRNQMEH
ncbi:MAG: AraC family transcriptional regulator [Bacteroidota bacterium]